MYQHLVLLRVGPWHKNVRNLLQRCSHVLKKTIIFFLLVFMAVVITGHTHAYGSCVWVWRRLTGQVTFRCAAHHLAGISFSLWFGMHLLAWNFSFPLHALIYVVLPPKDCKQWRKHLFCPSNSLASSDTWPLLDLQLHFWEVLFKDWFCTI